MTLNAGFPTASTSQGKLNGATFERRKARLRVPTNPSAAVGVGCEPVIEPRIAWPFSGYRNQTYTVVKR